MIQRPYYINWLERWRDKDVIKVITGLRRCGKSSVLAMYRENLLRSGVSPSNIHAFDFEDMAHDYPQDATELYSYIAARLSPGKNYVFLDEIQNIEDFEKLADGLFVRDDVDLYLTGSNAFFLSREIATLLTGRYVEIRMLPLSFAELHTCDALSNLSNDELFARYLDFGGMPFVAYLNNERDIADYLSGVFNTIVVNDAIARHPQINMRSFSATARFLADNIGNITSLNKISNGLKQNNKSVSVVSVGEYIDALTENFLAFEAQRFDIKGKAYLETLQKYYLGDLGFRFWLLGKQAKDLGHRLENVIYLELLRRYGQVYVGKAGEREVDFVAQDNGLTHYYQVSASVLDPATLERELAPLASIKDAYPKTLITLDRVGLGDYDGINHVNAIDWLLTQSDTAWI